MHNFGRDICYIIANLFIFKTKFHDLFCYEGNGNWLSSVVIAILNAILQKMDISFKTVD